MAFEAGLFVLLLAFRGVVALPVFVADCAIGSAILAASTIAATMSVYTTCRL